MEKVKRIYASLILAFMAVILIGCSVKSDNGTYTYEPSTEEVSKLAENQGDFATTFGSVIGESVKLSVSITINDDKGNIKISSTIMGFKNDQNYDVKVDQSKKVMTPVGGGTEVPYKISGDNLTFDVSKVDGEDASNLKVLKNAIFKRQK